MEQYNVYLHNVPKVGEDGKVVPINPPQTKDFSQLEDASKFAAEKKDEFERVNVIYTTDDKQQLIERFMDGEHIVVEVKEDAAETTQDAAETDDEVATAEEEVSETVEAEDEVPS